MHNQASKRLQSRYSQNMSSGVYCVPQSLTTQTDIAIAQNSSPHLASQHSHASRLGPNSPCQWIRSPPTPRKVQRSGQVYRAAQEKATVPSHSVREGKHFPLQTAVHCGREALPAPRPKRELRLWGRMQDLQNLRFDALSFFQPSQPKPSLYPLTWMNAPMHP